MTIAESLMLLRMLVDDSKDDYIPAMVKVDMLYKAQLRFVEESYTMGDERVLRPLYRTTGRVMSAQPIATFETSWATAYVKPMYPRTCMIYESLTAAANTAVHANYLEPSLFFNYDKPSFATGSSFPRMATYTVTTRYNGTFGREMVYFFFDNMGLTIAYGELVYIKQPFPFNLYPLAGATFETPTETHPAIVARAAEMLVDIDVDEMSRSKPERVPSLKIENLGGAE